MKGSQDKCFCIKYDENGVSEHLRDAVFISVTIPRGGESSLGASGHFPPRGILPWVPAAISRGGESFPGCQRPFPAAGFHCDLLFEVPLQAFGQQQVMGFELGIDGVRNALGQEDR